MVFSNLLENFVLFFFIFFIVHGFAQRRCGCRWYTGPGLTKVTWPQAIAVAELAFPAIAFLGDLLAIPSADGAIRSADGALLATRLRCYAIVARGLLATSLQCRATVAWAVPTLIACRT